MSGRRLTLAYVAALLFFNGMGDPTGLISVPVLFTLKDQLHAGPQAVALFEAITLIPVYAALLFGLLRDRWSPFGRRDRGYFAIAAPVAIASYIWLAAVPTGYWQLLTGILGAMIAYQMLDVASGALVTVIAQRESATGKLSALWEMMETAVRMLSSLAGGWMVYHLSLRTIFLFAAVFTLPIFALAFWSPKAVFPDSQSSAENADSESFRALYRRLAAQRRTLWFLVVILLLYSFSPGWGTPLFYYLTNEVNLPSEVFGLCRAVQYGGILLAASVYGALCVRIPVRKLLVLAIAVNILPAFLYLLIRGTAGAITVSLLVGIISGFSTVAVFDLLMRCCPPGLEGAGLALGHSTFGLAGAFGDVLGATVYAHGGFTACLIIDALATAAILPLLRHLPPTLLSDTDMEPANV